jgi:hypothetical protein
MKQRRNKRCKNVKNIGICKNIKDADRGKNAGTL